MKLVRFKFKSKEMLTEYTTRFRRHIWAVGFSANAVLLPESTNAVKLKVFSMVKLSKNLFLRKKVGFLLPPLSLKSFVKK